MTGIETQRLGQRIGSRRETNSRAARRTGKFVDACLQGGRVGQNVFGADGVGIFPAPTVIAAEVMTQYNVESLGRATDVRESFYAISAERKVKHAAVVAISEQARQDVFGREAQ